MKAVYKKINHPKSFFFLFVKQLLALLRPERVQSTNSKRARPDLAKQPSKVYNHILGQKRKKSLNHILVLNYNSEIKFEEMLARTEWSFDQMEILKNCGPLKEHDLSEHSKQMKFTSNIVYTYKHICFT